MPRAHNTLLLLLSAGAATASSGQQIKTAKMRACGDDGPRGGKNGKRANERGCRILAARLKGTTRHGTEERGGKNHKDKRYARIHINNIPVIMQARGGGCGRLGSTDPPKLRKPTATPRPTTVTRARQPVVEANNVDGRCPQCCQRKKKNPRPSNIAASSVRNRVRYCYCEISRARLPSKNGNERARTARAKGIVVWSADARGKSKF